MDRLRAREEAIIQLGTLFEEQVYCGGGTYCLYVNKGRLGCQRLLPDMPARDYFATLTASDFVAGLKSSNWDDLIHHTAERIYWQCKNKAQ